MKKSFFFLNFVILFFVFGCVLSINQVLAWTEPTSVPPQNNVPAPLNVSVDPQSKAGSLSLLSGANPTAEYGLSVATGTKASISSTNLAKSTTVKVNSIDTMNAANYYGVFVNSSKASAAGMYSYVDGVNSYAGKFSNMSNNGTGLYSYANGSGIGLYAYSNLGTGAIVHGNVMGLQVESVSNNASVVATNSAFETKINFPSSVIEQTSTLFKNYGVLSKAVFPGPSVYKVAVSGQYNDANYGELGQQGIGVYGKGDNYAGRFEGNVLITGGNLVTSGKLGALKGLEVRDGGEAYAGLFRGAVAITGKLTLQGGCTGCAADIAESLAREEIVSAGDIVATTTDLKLFRATKKDATLVGVVSTNPFLTLNEKNNGAPLALSGIVPTKVTAENGAIKAGDFITASSNPGFGMKAVAPGTVIGKALENFSGKQGKINILVSISYFPGLNCQK